MFKLVECFLCLGHLTHDKVHNLRPFLENIKEKAVYRMMFVPLVW